MLQDLRFAVRMLVKDRWFTLVAVLALGLGIGVNTTVFTFVNAVLIRGLPYADSERIIIVTTRNTTQANPGVASYQDLEDWRAQAKSFSGLACFQQTSMNVTDSGHTPEAYARRARLRERVQPARPAHASRTGLPAARRQEGRRSGRHPRLRRVENPVRRRRRTSSAKSINVNQVAATIVGVMPEGVQFPNNADIWQPLIPNEASLAAKCPQHERVRTTGDLASSMRQAQAEMSGIAGQLAQQFPDTNKNIEALVMTFNERFNGGPIRMVFLVAARRRRVRAADRLRQRRQPAARALRARALARWQSASRSAPAARASSASCWSRARCSPSSAVSSASGWRRRRQAVRSRGRQTRASRTGFSSPSIRSCSVTWPLICLATGILFGLAPALQVSKTNVNEILKEGGRGNAGGRRARWFTSTMVVVELALTIVLLVGAGLMIRSFLKMYSFELGAETSHVLTMRDRAAGSEVSQTGAAADLLRGAARQAAGDSRDAVGRHRVSHSVRGQRWAPARRSTAARAVRRAAAARCLHRHQLPLLRDARRDRPARPCAHRH